MSDTPEEWPTGWTGNGIIDCGESGRMSLKVCVDDGAFDVAKRNFKAILSRWPILWPEILAVLQPMLDYYKHPYKVANPIASLIIGIPSEDIDDGVEWNVAVAFSGCDGEWEVPMNGWMTVPENAQPYF
jgi:hypothetical protein